MTMVYINFELMMKGKKYKYLVNIVMKRKEKIGTAVYKVTCSSV